jgi:outer membrane biosynthesis protein TonB
VEAWAASKEAQRLAMMTWMQEREQNWDARCEDDNVWGAGTMTMIMKTMKGVAQGEEEKEREREATARTDGGGLTASQHTDMTREEGPEQHQQPQQQPKPKPKLQPVPKPKSALTPPPARQWETIPPRAKSQRAPFGLGPGLALTAVSSMGQRCLILSRDESVPLGNKMDQAITSAINRALFHQNPPAHIRIMNAKRNAKAGITAITHPNATAETTLQYRDIIITTARTVDKGVVDVEENESWEWPTMYTVPLIRYIGKGTEGLQKMQQDFEAENEGIVIPTQ